MNNACQMKSIVSYWQWSCDTPMWYHVSWNEQIKSQQKNSQDAVLHTSSTAWLWNFIWMAGLWQTSDRLFKGLKNCLLTIHWSIWRKAVKRDMQASQRENWIEFSFKRMLELRGGGCLCIEDVQGNGEGLNLASKLLGFHSRLLLGPFGTKRWTTKATGAEGNALWNSNERLKGQISQRLWQLCPSEATSHSPSVKSNKSVLKVFVLESILSET